MAPPGGHDFSKMGTKTGRILQAFSQYRLKPHLTGPAGRAGSRKNIKAQPRPFTCCQRLLSLFVLVQTLQPLDWPVLGHFEANLCRSEVQMSLRQADEATLFCCWACRWHHKVWASSDFFSENVQNFASPFAISTFCSRNSLNQVCSICSRSKKRAEAIGRVPKVSLLHF